MSQNFQVRLSGPPSAPVPPGIPVYGCYRELLEYHLAERAAALAVGDLSPQVAKNIRSRLQGWLRFSGLTEVTPVGEEFGEQFPAKLAEYVSDLRHRGLAAGTVNDHVCTLNSLRDSLGRLRCGDGLPPTVGQTLRHLIKMSGATRCQVMKSVGIPQGGLDTLLAGGRVKGSTLNFIPRLEEYFGLPEGTLSSRLPKILGRNSEAADCKIGYRKYLAEMMRLPYRLKEIPTRLAAEWADLAHFHLDPDWATLQGFECDPRYSWSKRPGRDYSATERLHWHQMCSFLGFLALPAESDDSRLRGKGMRANAFTIALLSDATLVAEYLEFRKARSYNLKANNGARTFLNLCSKLLYEKRGYLRQHPELGARLPEPVPPEQWPGWCTTNRSKILKLRLNGCARKSRHGTRPVSRDPFVVIGDFIRGRQHPLTVLWDLAANIEAQLAHAAYFSPVKVAKIWRNLLLVRLLAANPLRGGNLARLTYAPRHWEDLREPGVLRADAYEESNFYQTSDGAWRLRIGAEYFKVDRGQYDVPVPRSLWTTLRTYLFVQRPVLNHAILASIIQRRRKKGLESFTPRQMLAVLRCPYVFRYVRAGGGPAFAGYTGTEEVEVRTLSNTMMRLTRTHIPGCAGFGPHACRHLVATEKLKNDPSGKYEAAAALHADPDTVEEYYAEVTAGDRLKPWNEHHEKLREQWEKGKV